MPDPRDPRGVRHALVAVLALTACAVLAGRPLYWRSASGSPTPRRTSFNASAYASTRCSRSGFCLLKRRSCAAGSDQVASREVVYGFDLIRGFAPASGWCPHS
ncbi:transposase family protein [Streptomyces sp. NPDC057623]|uniref:transposase family protein n=1 Tax=Streptomyces sp. NPDC057623 TaxID=3346187 RepID=UPI003675A09B